MQPRYFVYNECDGLKKHIRINLQKVANYIKINLQKVANCAKINLQKVARNY